MDIQEFLENNFEHWMQSGVTPETILRAFHNACCHGTAFADDYNISDKQLEKLFEGFDKSLKALKKMAC